MWECCTGGDFKCKRSYSEVPQLISATDTFCLGVPAAKLPTTIFSATAIVRRYWQKGRRRAVRCIFLVRCWRANQKGCRCHPSRGGVSRTFAV